MNEAHPKPLSLYSYLWDITIASSDGYPVLPQTGALVCDDALQSFFQGQARTVADKLGQLAEVGDPPPYIFEALLIGPSVGDENNLRIRARHALDTCCQFADSNFVIAAHVIHFAVGIGMGRYADQRIHRIVDVGEAAALRAIAEDGNVPAGQGLDHQVGNDHAITPDLSRANGIEQARNHGRNFFLFPVRDGEKFVDGLRAGITPAALVGRAHHQVIIFMKRDPVPFAVYLRGRGDEHPFSLALRQAKYDFGAPDVGLDGAHGTVHNQAHPNGSRQMINDIGEVHEFGHQLCVGDGVNVVGKFRMNLEMLNISDRAGGEVVDDADFIAQVEMSLGEMRPDEARPSGNQHLHGRPPPLSTTTASKKWA